MLIDNFVHARNGFYGDGGDGPNTPEREAARLAGVHWMLDSYPALCRAMNLKGMAPGRNIRLRLTTEQQVDAWRATCPPPSWERAQLDP